MNKKALVKKISWLLIIIIPVLLGACGAPKIDWELKISGDVDNPLSFTFEELANMPMINLDDVLMEKSRGEDEVRSFSGVELSALLEMSGAPADIGTITAKAADGYAIEISPDEMADGIVALKQSDEWIAKVDPDAGPIRLVFPMTPANRWVFQVTEIVVNQSAETAVLAVGTKSYTRTQLEEFGTISVDYTNKDGETTTYSGVPLLALLEDAGITEPSIMLAFVASDGFEAEVALADIQDCDNCIVAFDEDYLRMILPDMSSKLQVKDVIEIKGN
jgi:DMSO/TMAO reductase YedYZ molybdopterin-dependent catalytic subunit